jgi:NAD(P)-dependent dehydrogenase (short-subunit alcohol dehydrogenase family)
MVVGLDIDPVGGQRTVSAIEASGGRADLIVGDASKSADIEGAVEHAARKFGKLNLLWSNAGIGLFKDVIGTTEAEWDHIIAVNLKSAYLMAHFGIPQVIAAGGGTMVLTASVNSFVAASSWAAYCATKGGLLMLCRAMALDYAKSNVRVNCVCPGSIDTPLLEQDMNSRGVPREVAMQQDLTAHPIGRIGRPHEVAQAALFLSCDDSSFTTGSALFVDGGYVAQ